MAELIPFGLRERSDTLASAWVEFQTAELRGVIGWVNDYSEALFSAEAALVADAVAKRVREFATGRKFAHILLANFVTEPQPLLSDDRRPLWPAGVIGSIAHSEKLAIVVGAPDDSLLGVGVDLERNDRLRTTEQRLVLTEAEHDTLADHTHTPPHLTGTHYFCAKEAVYKAINPHARVMVDFQEVEINFEEHAHSGCFSFRARYLGPDARTKHLDRGIGFCEPYQDHVLAHFKIPSP